MTSGAPLTTREPRTSGKEPLWNSLLQPFGVKVRPDLVYDLSSNQMVPVPGQGGASVYQPYPFWLRAQATGRTVVTDGVGEIFLPWASSIEILPGAKTKVTPLLISSRVAGIAEGDIDLSPTRQFPPVDLKPRVLGVSVMPGDSGGPRGRIVLVGNMEFATDRYASSATENAVFALNSIDWLAQDEALISIRSRDRRPPRLLFTTPGAATGGEVRQRRAGPAGGGAGRAGPADGAASTGAYPLVAPRGQSPGGRMSPQVLKRIALALVAALLVWGGLALYGRTRRDDAGGLNLPHILPGDVSEIAFRKAADTLVLVRQGQGWTVNGFPAGARAVQIFLGGSLGQHHPKRTGRPEPGLTPAPRRRQHGGQAAHHFFRWQSPARSLVWQPGSRLRGLLRRPEGSNIVYLLRGQFAELTVQSVPEWRDKEIAAVVADSIGQVEVGRGGKKWSLTRNGTAWKLGNAAADSTKVARFLQQFVTLRAAGFPEPEELDSIHFERPERTLSLRSRSGTSLLDLVFDSTHAGSFWVRTAIGGSVYRMDARTAELATPAESTFEHPK